MSSSKRVSGKTYWNDSNVHGVGVFAIGELEAGELIEECPIIVVPAEQMELADSTVLYDFYYSWPGGAGAIALGYGSLLNHSFEPNARYDLDVEGRAVVITAEKAIERDEEILINYVGHPDAYDALWFDLAAPSHN